MQAYAPNPEATASRKTNEAMHQAPAAKLVEYKTVKSTDKDLPEDLKALLGPFRIDGKKKNQYKQAGLSADGQLLYVGLNGQTALKHLFNDTWFARKKNYGSKIYTRLYNPKKNPELQYRSESLKSLKKHLRDDTYRVSLIYRKGPDGKFTSEPSSMAITDSYYGVIENNKSLSGAARKQALERHRREYTIDKLLPGEKASVKDDMQALIQGLYHAKKFRSLFVPFSLSGFNHPELEVLDLDWTHLVMDRKSDWQLIQGKAAIIRSADQKGTALDPELARLQAMTATTSGPDPLMKKDTQIELRKQAIAANQAIIGSSRKSLPR